MKHLVTAAMALALTTPVEALERPSVAPKNMQAVTPGLVGYTDDVLFGDVWVRPEFSPRDRSIVTLSVLIAMGKTAQLSGHLGRGLNNGIKPTEIAGMVTHLAFYTGWPNAVSSLNEVEKVFAERKIDASALRLAPGAAPAIIRPSDVVHAATVQRDVSPAAPKFAELTNEVIIGDLWRRTDLAPRDRSLVTIGALAAGGDTDQLTFHIVRGLENGLTKADIGEALTHLAFYAGWPKASAAVAVAGRVFAKDTLSPEPKVQLIPPGLTPVTGSGANFTGSAVVKSPFKGTGSARLGGATVTFKPGARTNWHTHALGQLLIVTEGKGWVQAEGETARAIKPGDVVWIAPAVKHWHGATRTSAMTHVAVAEVAADTSVTWLEPVSEDVYKGPR